MPLSLHHPYRCTQQRCIGCRPHRVDAKIRSKVAYYFRPPGMRCTHPFAHCGPNKSTGRFRRYHASSNLSNRLTSDSDKQEDTLRPKPHILTAIWSLLVPAAIACCMLPCLSAMATSQQQVMPGKPAIAEVREAQSLSSSLDHSGARPAQPQAFASISTASFASLFSSAQRAHAAQILVYQAQRVSLAVYYHCICFALVESMYVCLFDVLGTN